MTPEEKDWAMACHLAAFAGYIIPLGWVIGPLVVWLARRNHYPLVDEQGKESLNFQISLLIYGLVAGILCIIFVGLILLVALGVFQIVLVIIATVRVSRGEHYRYPLTIRFIR